LAGYLNVSNRGSITLGELQGKLEILEIKCHRCERHSRISLARLIHEHEADTGLPDLSDSLLGDCPNAHTTALNNRYAIYYPQLPALFLPGKET
jgi:hypothetical protein